MLNRSVIRIDMRLTDKAVLETISELAAKHDGRITYEQIAEHSRCCISTARVSTMRLKRDGHLLMEGGKGRRPVIYKVVKNA